MEKLTYEQLETRYRSLVADYNKMVKEHNELVVAHDKLSEDSRCLLMFIEDLTRGMKAYARRGIQLGTIDPCEPVSVPAQLRLDEGRVFVAELHNVISNLLAQVKEGIPITVAYANWRQLCNEVKDNQNGGGFLI